jgi:hypothetical protein
MKIAIFSESLADDTAVQILVEGLVGGPIERIGIPWLKTRGWPSLLDVLPKVMLHFHYQTDVRGLIVVADSDRSPLHRQLTASSPACAEKCRLCHLRNAVAETRKRLVPIPGRAALGVAVGLAIPSIEAWYRCGLDNQVSEATWSRAIESGDFPYDTKRLKRILYGSNLATISLALRVANEQSRRLVAENRLTLLEQLFPVGFGSLAEEVRTWRS